MVKGRNASAFGSLVCGILLGTHDAHVSKLTPLQIIGLRRRLYAIIIRRCKPDSHHGEMQHQDNHVTDRDLQPATSGVHRSSNNTSTHSHVPSNQMRAPNKTTVTLRPMDYQKWRTMTSYIRLKMSVLRSRSRVQDLPPHKPKSTQINTFFKHPTSLYCQYVFHHG